MYYAREISFISFFVLLNKYHTACAVDRLESASITNERKIMKKFLLKIAAYLKKT